MDNIEVTKSEKNTLLVTRSMPVQIEYSYEYLIEQREKIVEQRSRELAQRDAEIAEVDMLLAQCKKLGIEKSLVELINIKDKQL